MDQGGYCDNCKGAIQADRDRLAGELENALQILVTCRCPSDCDLPDYGGSNDICPYEDENDCMKCWRQALAVQK